MYEYIEFNGKMYPVRWVYVPDFGGRLIGNKTLEGDLCGDGMWVEYANDEAKRIDEAIFFYVEDDELEMEELGAYVAAEVC